jgi:hypothetical protein
MPEPVIFQEEDMETHHAVPKSQKPSFMMKLAFKTGLVKTPQGANVLFLLLSVVCLILAAFALFAGGVVRFP